MNYAWKNVKITFFLTFFWVAIPFKWYRNISGRDTAIISFDKLYGIGFYQL